MDINQSEDHQDFLFNTSDFVFINEVRGGVQQKVLEHLLHFLLNTSNVVILLYGLYLAAPKTSSQGLVFTIVST